MSNEKELNKVKGFFNPIEKSAIFSDCRKYRYVLKRIWDKTKGDILFVCLNPSTADENTNDPTIRRCIQFAHLWGYGGMIMCNLYAYKSTDPKILSQVKNPIGPDNDFYIRLNSKQARITIAAWGAIGGKSERSDIVMNMLYHIHYLKLTKDGYPAHPLYLKKDLVPKYYEKT